MYIVTYYICQSRCLYHKGNFHKAIRFINTLLVFSRSSGRRGGQQADRILPSSGAAHTVVGGLQSPVAPVLQAVPNIDGYGPGDRVKGHPLGLLGLLAICCQPRAHLQPCLTCTRRRKNLLCSCCLGVEGHPTGPCCQLLSALNTLPALWICTKQLRHCHTGTI